MRFVFFPLWSPSHELPGIWEWNSRNTFFVLILKAIHSSATDSHLNFLLLLITPSNGKKNPKKVALFHEIGENMNHLFHHVPNTKFAKRQQSCRQSCDSDPTYVFVCVLEQFGCATVIHQQSNMLNMNTPVCILYINNRKKQGRPLYTKQI